MRSTAPGQRFADGTWPETLTLAPDRLFDDLHSGRAAVEAAVARSQRLDLSAPLPLGTDPSRDLAALRFLTEVAVQMAGLGWTLAGEPPWPVRTLVHLPPPSDGADPIAREYAAHWRRDHQSGLCTYRRGPGFVRIRDVRPGGPHLRVVVDGPWADVFDSVVDLPAEGAQVTEGPRRQLLDELVAAGLAMAVGAVTYVLPIRLRRWPIPYTAV
jgi:hypothetical protein